jgi:hypothetical protein
LPAVIVGGGRVGQALAEMAGKLLSSSTRPTFSLLLLRASE